MKNTDYDYQFRDYSKEELRQQCVLLHQYSLELEKENRELKKRICRLETLLDYYEGKETE